MSMIHGYTHAGAIQRAPTSIQQTVTPHIQALHEMGVKASNQSAPPPKQYGIIASWGGVHDSLKSEFAKSGRKAFDITSQISSQALEGGVNEKLQKRLANLTPDQAKTLKDQLHYSAWQAHTSGTTSEDRLVIRTALVLAFAHGASLDDTARLKQFLNTADSATRNSVLAALNKPDANPTDVLTYFQAVPMDAVDQIQAWVRRDDSVNATKIPKLVDNFLSINAQKLGVAPNSPEYQNLKIGATAISAYTSDIYKDVNKELRQNPPDQISPQIEMLTVAAKDFLSRLPDFQGIVARGGGSGWQDIARARYVPGQVVTEPTFISSSPNKGFDGSVQFIIESRHGKEVSGLSVNGSFDGREVLFPPGTKFEVLAVETASETYSFFGTSKTDNPNNEKTMFIVLREVD